MKDQEKKEKNKQSKLTFINNLKRHMENRGVNAVELAKGLDMPYNTILDWINGNRYPRLDGMDALADYFGVLKSNLIDPPIEPTDFCEKLNYYKRVPLLGIIPGGPPMLAAESYDEYIPVTDKTLDFALRVKGDSMINARIYPGDTVFIDADAEIKNGDVVVALIDGSDATIKRFYQYGGLVILRPENPAYEENTYKADEVKLLGKVKKVVYEIK